MALVYEGDEILWEIVEQAERSLAGLAPVKIAGIVLYAGAVAHLLYHLQVVLYSLLEPLCLKPLAYVVEIVKLALEVVLYVADSRYAAFLCGDEVVGWIDVYLVD